MFLTVIVWALFLTYLRGKKYLIFGLNAFSIFLLYILADILSFYHVPIWRSSNDLISYIHLSMSMGLLAVVWYQQVRFRFGKIAFILIPLSVFFILIFPMFRIFYYLNFDTYVTEEVFYAIFQSNFKESLEYSLSFGLIKWFIVFLIIVGLFSYSLYKQERSKKRIEISLVAMLLIIFGSSLYISGKQQGLRVVSGIFFSAKKYQKELNAFREVRKKRNIHKTVFDAKKTGVGETYIVVIGESLNKKHMGIYGYLRDTTPALSNDKGLLVFNDAYSNHTHSIQVLSKALTESNQYNKQKYYESLSIINILKEANIETFWITNQVLYGSWDNVITAIAEESDHLISLNKHIGRTTKTQKFDNSVFEPIKEVLNQKTEKNRVVFVHLMGNHASYCARFPKEYQYFTGPLPRHKYGNLSDRKKSEVINCYDNSVLYNDYVVSKILGLLKNKNKKSGFIYFADHADDVFSGLGHNSSTFTYSMTGIPFIAWFSEKYRKQYPERFRTFKNNVNTIFSNDLIYNTLIGLLGIQTKYNKSYDLSSLDYNLKKEQALVLHGKKKFFSRENKKYVQTNNIRKLKSKKESIRIIPHRVNSIGKLKDVWQDGFQAYEVDVLFNRSKKCFEVGHGKKTMSGICFYDFISNIQTEKIKKIWIDFKNLNLDSYREALDRLITLEKVVGGFKNKLIIESSTRMNEFKIFSELGYHTSYYLPTGKIVGLLKEENNAEMKRLAQSIAKQTRRQKLAAVSFDYRLYPFVKDYLEPFLDNAVFYHTWDIGISLSDIEFSTKIKKKRYYRDERVKTILVHYQSIFDL